MGKGKKTARVPVENSEEEDVEMKGNQENVNGSSSHEKSLYEVLVIFSFYAYLISSILLPFVGGFSFLCQVIAGLYLKKQNFIYLSNYIYLEKVT